MKMNLKQQKQEIRPMRYFLFKFWGVDIQKPGAIVNKDYLLMRISLSTDLKLALHTLRKNSEKIKSTRIWNNRTQPKPLIVPEKQNISGETKCLNHKTITDGYPCKISAISPIN